MPIRKRTKSPTEQTGELLDLPLGGAVSVEPGPSPGDSSRVSPASGVSSGGTSKQRLGDVDAIGSLDRRRQPRRGRAGWWWLILLLAIPLSVLIGYLLKTDPPLAALSTDLLDFGEVRLGATGDAQTLRISNQGEQALVLTAATMAGEGAGEFTVAKDGCGGLEVSAQADCILLLTFTPASRGARRAQIQLDSNALDGPQTVPLIGVGVAPELTVEPTDLDFGQRITGGPRATATLRLGNRGTAPLQLGRVELSGSGTANFRTVNDGCRSRLLAPGERCTLSFAFAPTGDGESRAELSIASDAGPPQTVELRGQASRQIPILRLAPTALDFEPLPVAQVSPSQTVTVANDGNGPLPVRAIQIEVDPSVAATAFEIVAENCTTGDVPPNGACEIELRFNPSAEGEVQAALVIDSNAASATPGGDTPDAPHRIPLTGAGILPHAVITPERLSFGEVAVKALSGPRAVRVANPGSDELQISSATVSGADATSFTIRGCAGAAVAPGQGYRLPASGETCLLEVIFRPGRAGPHRAALQIMHNAGSGHHTLPLNGIGVAARLSLNHNSLDFGDVEIGTETQRQLTLTNAGRSELKILRLRLTGRHADFELDPATCAPGGTDGATLGPNVSCTLTVRFRPPSAGNHRLQLVIDHSAANTAREVPVTARATAPPEPAILLKPTSFDFPDRRVGERSTIKTLTVENSGTARLNLEDVYLVGDHQGDFQLVPGSCASFVAPGASCTVGIRFAPTTDGPRQTELLIRHNAAAGTAKLPLRGNGTRPPPVP